MMSIGTPLMWSLFVAFVFVAFSFCLTSPNFACAFPRVF